MNVNRMIVGAIGIVVIVIVLLALTPTIVSQVQSIIWQSTQTGGTGHGGAANDTDWNFTGFLGARSMLGLVPFVWVAAVLLGAVVGMLGLYRGKGD